MSPVLFAAALPMSTDPQCWHGVVAGPVALLRAKAIPLWIQTLWFIKAAYLRELCSLLLSFHIMKQAVYKLELSFLSLSESNCQLQSCNKSEHLKAAQRSFCVCKALTVRLWFWKTSQTKASSLFRIIWIFKAMKLGRFGSEVLIIGSFLFFVLLSVLAQIVDVVYQFSLILRLQNS